ncbi:Imm50 family immunity protein [Pseudomonas sp. MWU12-2037]|uniref:Imm50 family immunity protein n=1 Tax=Pseudomonas sp. MWU12-2037 TaxID=2928690 RepID=UPI00200BE283|nr:Imm50 family immunity protein [Pseudomonas sp. MWU12-2037]
MKYWNDLDGSTFFNKVFNTKIQIGSISLYSLRIDNDRPEITFGFDIDELPDTPPEKWKKTEFNTCRLGLNCGSPADLIIKNIPTAEKLYLTIENHDDYYLIRAKSEHSLIEFKTKWPLLCGPTVYLNDPDSAYS